MKPLEVKSCTVTGKIQSVDPLSVQQRFPFTIRSHRFKSTRICSSLNRSAALFDTGTMVATTPSELSALRHFRTVCQKLGGTTVEEPQCSNIFVVGQLSHSVDLEMLSRTFPRARFDSVGSRTSRSVVRLNYPSLAASVSVFASGKLQLQTRQMPDLEACAQALAMLKDFAPRSP